MPADHLPPVPLDHVSPVRATALLPTRTDRDAAKYGLVQHLAVHEDEHNAAVLNLVLGAAAKIKYEALVEDRLVGVLLCWRLLLRYSLTGVHQVHLDKRI